MRTVTDMLKDSTLSRSDSDAKFLGWQERLSGKNIALYNITAVDHPLFGSTVSEKSLRVLNLQVPDAPGPEKFVK